MQRAILFGAGGGGKRLYSKVRRKYNIVAIVDNDSGKWGSSFGDLVVGKPEMVCADKNLYDVVVITSMPGLDSIIKQLENYGVEYSQIDVSYVIQPLESWRGFLQRLAELADKKTNYAVAEAGVFQGDFAKYINKYFADRKFYMFDTFEGFEEKDILIEEEKKFSHARTNDYGNTNIALVLGKMENPHNCEIKKGYFPQTAKGIEDCFYFVNLDLDLYQPTGAGLQWFENRMISGGNSCP